MPDPSSAPAVDATDDTPVLETTDEAVVEDDLIVEDVSIDGMCGVY